MDPVTVSGLFSLGQSLIKRLWPDKDKQQEELRKLAQMQQEGDLAKMQMEVDLMLAQAEINLADSNSDDWFQRRWRSSVGWVCAFGLGYTYILHPIMNYIFLTLQAFGKIPSEVLPPPSMDISTLMPLLMGMLGLVGARSFDKTKGNHLK